MVAGFGSPMKAYFKGAALFVAVASLVWIGVLWRWRLTQRDMDGGDIVLYLGALPVTVFALVWAVRWAVRGALRRQDAKANPTLAAGASGAALSAAAPADADGAPVTWHLLGAWARTAAGASVDELLAAAQVGAPRPRPDPDLHDDEGLPVMTARIAGLDADAQAVDGDLQRHCANALARVDAAGPGAAQGAESPLRAARALAILLPLLEELVQSLDLWSGQWVDAVTAAPSATTVSSSSPTTPGAADKVVRLLAAWPADWDDATCAAAQAWLVERLCEPLAAALPPARWSIRTQRMNGTELLAATGRTLGVLRDQGRDDPVVLLACHSDLDDAGIRALDNQQRLFHSVRRPRASMPGEGAAVLVLSAVAWPADAALESDRILLQSPAIARRSQSVESPGRTSSEETVALAKVGLGRAGLAGGAVAKLASDADQHSARATELFAVTLALLPDLDANEDFCLAGSLTGRLEAVAPLLTLACAAAQARDSGQPAAALSLADPYWRMTAILRPESFSSLPAAAPA